MIKHVRTLERWEDCHPQISDSSSLSRLSSRRPQQSWCRHGLDLISNLLHQRPHPEVSSGSLSPPSAAFSDQSLYPHKLKHSSLSPLYIFHWFHVALLLYLSVRTVLSFSFHTRLSLRPSVLLMDGGSQCAQAACMLWIIWEFQAVIISFLLISA